MGFYSRGDKYKLLTRHGAMGVNKTYRYDHVLAGRWHYWIAARTPHELIKDRQRIEEYTDMIAEQIGSALDGRDYKAGKITFPLHVNPPFNAPFQPYRQNINISVAR